MAPYELRPVDFSVLSLVLHNPGITSRQLCTTLGILPPNLVGMVSAFEARDLIVRTPHPRDRRAMGLHLTDGGRKLMRRAERTAAQLEAQAASRLTAAEARMLIRLLQKMYRG
jgi:DNA-binding MarR family transcriptional regulator